MSSGRRRGCKEAEVSGSGTRTGERNVLLVSRSELDPILVIVPLASSLDAQALPRLIVPRRRRRGRLVLILQLDLEVGDLAIGPPELRNDRVLLLPLGAAAARRVALLLADGEVRDRGGRTERYGGRHKAARVGAVFLGRGAAGSRSALRKPHGIVSARIKELPRGADLTRQARGRSSGGTTGPLLILTSSCGPPLLFPPTPSLSPILGAPTARPPTRGALLALQTLLALLLPPTIPPPSQIAHLNRLALAPRLVPRRRRGRGGGAALLVAQLPLPSSLGRSLRRSIGVEQSTAAARSLVLLLPTAAATDCARSSSCRPSCAAASRGANAAIEFSVVPLLMVNALRWIPMSMTAAVMVGVLICGGGGGGGGGEDGEGSVRACGRVR